MNSGLLLMRVKRFITDPNSVKYIKYDWDGGHAYSYIDHPIMDGIEEYESLEQVMYKWLYDNDQCPPCAIYVDLTNHEVSSGCGCHDDLTYEEGLDVVNQLKEFCKDPNYKSQLKYLVNYE